MIRAIAFKGGYVESNTCSWLVYQVPDSEVFQTPKEALSSLSHYLFHKFSLDFHQNYINADHWHDYIRTIFGFTNDDYGYGNAEEAQIACGRSWNYYEYNFDIPLDKILVIYERAENVFLCALRDNHSDLFSKLDEDDDFIDGPNDIDLDAYKKLIGV